MRTVEVLLRHGGGIIIAIQNIQESSTILCVSLHPSSPVQVCDYVEEGCKSLHTHTTESAMSSPTQRKNRDEAKKWEKLPCFPSWMDGWMDGASHLTLYTLTVASKLYILKLLSFFGFYSPINSSNHFILIPLRGHWRGAGLRSRRSRLQHDSHKVFQLIYGTFSKVVGLFGRRSVSYATGRGKTVSSSSTPTKYKGYSRGVCSVWTGRPPFTNTNALSSFVHKQTIIRRHLHCNTQSLNSLLLLCFCFFSSNELYRCTTYSFMMY